jgi:hypothetical protein
MDFIFSPQGAQRFAEGSLPITLPWAVDQIVGHVLFLFSLKHGLNFNWCAQNEIRPVAGTSAVLCDPCG